jgi:hypothetical protein
MKLHTISYNVCGLNLEGEVHKLHYFFQGLSPQVNLQEHKFRQKKAKIVAKMLWLDIQTWLKEVDKGYISKIQQGEVGKGDTFNLMDPKWGKFVIEHWTIGGNKM